MRRRPKACQDYNMLRAASTPKRKSSRQSISSILSERVGSLPLRRSCSWPLLAKAAVCVRSESKNLLLFTRGRFLPPCGGLLASDSVAAHSSWDGARRMRRHCVAQVLLVLRLRSAGGPSAMVSRLRRDSPRGSGRAVCVAGDSISISKKRTGGKLSADVRREVLHEVGNVVAAYHS